MGETLLIAGRPRDRPSAPARARHRTAGRARVAAGAIGATGKAGSYFWWRAAMTWGWRTRCMICADRIGWRAAAPDPLAEVRETRERPAVRDRTISTYTMQQAWFESRLFNEAYWVAYFDNLVRNRFNNFSLLFGYESTGYLAPPYAWFFDLPEFPEVKAVGVTREQQQRYIRALNRVTDQAHERGLHVTLGIWDHIYDGVSSYYTEGVWDHLPVKNGRRALAGGRS